MSLFWKLFKQLSKMYNTTKTGRQINGHTLTTSFTATKANGDVDNDEETQGPAHLRVRHMTIFSLARSGICAVYNDEVKGYVRFHIT